MVSNIIIIKENTINLFIDDIRDFKINVNKL